MPNKIWNVYLSGEIHTNWREEIAGGIKSLQLPVNLENPVTIHSDSDDCGVNILGPENNSFWHDYKGASINSIRTRKMIKDSDKDKWDEDFKRRKEEWVKRIRLDPGIEETMNIVEDHLKINKMVVSVK